MYYFRQPDGSWLYRGLPPADPPPERRADDAGLLALAEALAPGLRDRLVELVEAPEGAAAYVEQRDRAQRADDLAQECRRQLHSLQRQHDTAQERLALARHALVATGYFTEAEVGPDVAPRITELWAHVTTPDHGSQRDGL